MKGFRAVYVVGFTIFALVIIFSILAEADLIFTGPVEQTDAIDVGHLERKADTLDGLNRKRYLQSLEGRRVQIQGDVERTGLIHLSLVDKEMKRGIKVNFTRKLRKSVSSNESVEFSGIMRRVSVSRRYIIFELSDFGEAGGTKR